MKNKNKHYRQGDVAIQRIAFLPKNLKLADRENGRVILAHGEVTGHAHAFLGAGTKKFTDDRGREFFEVRGQEIKATLPIMRRWKSQLMVDHPRLGIIEFAETDVHIIGDHVVIDGEFELLKHDEHHAHGVPSGLYSGANDANGTVRQREYSPEAIRNVAD